MALKGNFGLLTGFFERCNLSHGARIRYKIPSGDAFLIQNAAVLPQSRLEAVTDWHQSAIVGRRSLAVIPDPSAPPAPRGDCFEPLDTHHFVDFAARPSLGALLFHERKFSCTLLVIPLLAWFNEWG
ncbi:MAG: hypothetical protein AAGL09_15120 [Pseudomonadota bacterium]